jgi:hypothetical protein
MKMQWNGQARPKARRPSRRAFLSGYRPPSSLSDTDVLRIMIGTGMNLTLIGMLDAAIGWIIRSTPGALVALSESSSCCRCVSPKPQVRSAPSRSTGK